MSHVGIRTEADKFILGFPSLILQTDRTSLTQPMEPAQVCSACPQEWLEQALALKCVRTSAHWTNFVKLDRFEVSELKRRSSRVDLFAVSPRPGMEVPPTAENRHTVRNLASESLH